jgi:ribose transport system ATP-binding protein
MSVADNITVRVPDQLRRWGTWLDREAIRQLVAAMMKRLAIKAPDSGVLIETLSGGNQQKTSLARLLAEDLSVLVLDEPTHGIDVAAKADLLAELDRLADAGMAVIVIGSELDQLIAAADRILVFRQGRVVAEMPAQDADEVTLVRLASGAAA